MLIVGGGKRWRPWKEAGARLLLSPLSPGRHAELSAMTTTIVRDDDNKVIDVKRDVAEFARLVGRECVHGWEGIADANKHPLTFSQAAADALMSIGPAEAFVMSEVTGLGMHIEKEVENAGNG